MQPIIPRLKRFCLACSGEDAYIIRKCDRRIRDGFLRIGLFVLVIFALCWFSAMLFMAHVFDGARWISIPLGIFWALLVINLYLLLLYTISPALLPVAEKVKTAIGSKAVKTVVRKEKKTKPVLLQFSFVARAGFIVFLAVVIAQPFNVWWFSPGYEDADRLAVAIREVGHTKPFSWLVTILFCVTMLLPVYFKFRIRKVSAQSFATDFGNDEAVASLRNLREQLGNPSEHGHLTEQILAADISTISTSDFYFQKTLIEYRIVLEEYEQFKKNYSDILTGLDKKYKQACWNVLMPYLYKLERVNPERYDLLYPPLKQYLQAEKIERYEYWSDAPFRTTCRPADRALTEQAGLLQLFYQINDPDNERK